jgi:hypothetical protein
MPSLGAGLMHMHRCCALTPEQLHKTKPPRKLHATGFAFFLNHEKQFIY